MSKDRADSAAVSSASLVSWPLRLAASWSWRVAAVIITVGLLMYLITPLAALIISVMGALLLTVVLSPLVGWLRRRFGMGRTPAAIIAFVGGVIPVSLLFALVADQVFDELPRMIRESIRGVSTLVSQLDDTVFSESSAGIRDFLGDFEGDVGALLSAHGGFIANEAFVLASSAAGVLSLGIIVLFTLFFLLRDGRRIWIWFVRLLPAGAREPANEAGIRGWVTLGAYVKTQVQVAAIDALGIGLGAYFLGAPLALSIGVLVFFFAFIPIVGAFVSGFIAVFIVLVNLGFGKALIMLLIVLLVQQLEGNVLHPLMMGHAVSLHPLAVVLAVMAGSALAGIPGALFAVPVLAFINVVTLYLHGWDMLPDLATDPLRPGGPPGSLDEQIAESYSRTGVVRMPAAERLQDSLAIAQAEQDEQIDDEVAEAEQNA